MRFRWALLLFPALLAAEEWKSVRIGPFEVLSTSEKDGREALKTWIKTYIK